MNDKKLNDAGDKSAQAEENKKTFEISGMKSIKVSENYCAEWEEKDTLLLFNPKTNDVWIRISSINAEPKDGNGNGNGIFDIVIEEGKEKELEVKILDDKSYYVTSNEYVEDGDEIITYYYNIGCKCTYIILSVTTLLNNSKTEGFKNELAEIPNIIASIKDFSLEKNKHFCITEDNANYINKRCADILEITEEELDDFHKTGKTLQIIQKYLDEKKFTAEQTEELQSLGYAFGDYIQYKYPDFQWEIVIDEYGKDYALKYANTTINIFPVTMIAKRVEDGEEDFNVERFLQALLKQIKKMEKDYVSEK